jgi:hypothetical protein
MQLELPDRPCLFITSYQLQNDGTVAKCSTADTSVRSACFRATMKNIAGHLVVTVTTLALTLVSVHRVVSACTARFGSFSTCSAEHSRPSDSVSPDVRDFDVSWSHFGSTVSTFRVQLRRIGVRRRGLRRSPTVQTSSVFH